MTAPFSGHAERMDRMYRLQRHIYDATRLPYLLGRRRLIDDLRPPLEGAILEIGCGTGWNLVHAAAHYPDCTLCGVDISAVMLETARRSAVRAGVASRISLVRADAAGLDAARLGRPAFDRVVFSYALSMIPAWPQALAHAIACTAAGGSLHIVDFGDFSGLPPLARRGLEAWLDAFHVIPRRDLYPVLDHLAQAHGMRLAFKQLHAGYVASAVLSR